MNFIRVVVISSTAWTDGLSQRRNNWGFPKEPREQLLEDGQDDTLKKFPLHKIICIRWSKGRCCILFCRLMLNNALGALVQEQFLEIFYEKMIKQ